MIDELFSYRFGTYKMMKRGAEDRVSWKSWMPKTWRIFIRQKTYDDDGSIGGNEHN